MINILKLSKFAKIKSYSFATWADCLLITVGMVLSILTGILDPFLDTLFEPIIENMIQFSELNGTSEERKIIEDKFMDENLNFTISSCILGCGVIILTYISILLVNRSAGRQISKIRLCYMQAILNKDISWYDLNKPSEFSSQISEDLDKIEEAIGDKSAVFVFCISILVIRLVISFVLGWELTLICLLYLPCSLVTTGIITYITNKVALNDMDTYGKAGSIAVEVFSSIRTVIAFGGQTNEIGRYKKYLNIAEKNNIRRSIFTGFSNGCMWLLVYGSFALSFWYGTNLIINERKIPENERKYSHINFVAIFFNILTGAIYFAQCQPYFGIFALGNAATNKIFSIIEDQPIINLSKNKGKKLTKLQGKISFENVQFHYPSRPDVKILQGLSLTINAGETVALVGMSGCGKSTCISLMQRFYDTFKGVIVVDDTEIKEYDLTWLRNQFGVVSQEPVLFGTTIGENIRYGNLDATDEDIIEASKKANAHDFVANLPLQYNTLVGENGAQLSKGQKQRIAIARALVRNPSILLLDDPTSALDTSSEAQVQKALAEANKERTTIIVTNRLSTIRYADKIFVISEGKVLEEGCHEDLMSNRGAYFNLVSAQLSKDSNEDLIVTDNSENMGLGEKENDIDVLFNNKNEDNDEEYKMNIFQIVVEILKINKPEYLYVTLACIGAVIAGSAVPMYSIIFGNLLDTLSNADDEYVKYHGNRLSICLAIMGIIVCIASFFEWYLFERLGEKLKTRVRSKMFETILKQEIGWFDSKENGTGAICTRLSGEASSVQGAFGQCFGILVNSLTSLVLGISISLYYQWKLTLVNLIFILLILIGIYLEKKLISKNSISNATKESSKLAVEVVSNIRTVASLGCETKFLQMYMSIIDAHRSKFSADVHIRGFIFGMIRSLQFFTYSFSALYGGYLMKNEGLDYEVVLTAMEGIILSTWGLTSNLAFTSNFHKGIQASSKIIALFKRIPTIHDKENFQTVKGDKSIIQYKNISFYYPTRKESKVLNNLDLIIQHGKTVALVGPSGSGKSTIIQLLERFYDPNFGNIMIDNQNIKSAKLLSLRKQLSVVSEEPNLFDRTIFENIAYGDNSRNVTQYEIIEAAKDANIHNFISSLPLGYETHLGEKGNQLSVGQKQRVAIARALVRNPQILLLDEATSALDAESEKIVQEGLDRAKSGKTFITTAHRLSKIQDADVICVINNGTIAETGTHEELLSVNGIYYNLYKKQRSKTE